MVSELICVETLAYTACVHTEIRRHSYCKQHTISNQRILDELTSKWIREKKWELVHAACNDGPHQQVVSSALLSYPLSIALFIATLPSGYVASNNAASYLVTYYLEYYLNVFES